MCHTSLALEYHTAEKTSVILYPKQLLKVRNCIDNQDRHQQCWIALHVQFRFDQETRRGGLFPAVNRSAQCLQYPTVSREIGDMLTLDCLGV